MNANNRNSTDNGLINYTRNYPFHVTSDQDVVIHGEKLLKDVSHSHPVYFLSSSFDFFFFNFHLVHKFTRRSYKNPFHISDRTQGNRISSGEILSFYSGDKDTHKDFHYSHVICHGGLFIHLSND